MDKKIRWILVAMIILAVIGLADATYLTYQHYTASTLACIISQGCDIVTASPYSKIFGVYLSVYGIIYYLAVFILSIVSLKIHWKLPQRGPELAEGKIENWKFKWLLFALTACGFLASAYFVYLQLFVIHAICTWCMISAIDSTILFILAPFLVSSKKSPSTPTVHHQLPPTT